MSVAVQRLRPPVPTFAFGVEVYLGAFPRWFGVWVNLGWFRVGLTRSPYK